MWNWARNLQYRAKALHEPRSTEEICHIVRPCDKVRPLGTRHSFNDIADCAGGDLISLRHMDRILRLDGLDGPRPTVTVEGGITYGQLCPQLDRHGWALHNLASLPHISVAGACATATHGSGDRNGNLATAVVGMKIVNAAGQVISATPDTVGERFNGMVVGLGTLGVVSELTLKIEPRFDARQEVFLNLPMPHTTDQFDQIMAAGDSVSLFTNWRQPIFGQVWLKIRANEKEPPRRTEFFGAAPAPVRMHPLADLPADNCNEQLAINGPWHARLPHFRLDFTPSHGVELQSEYFVPRRRAVEAIEAVYDLRAEISPLLKISEIRTIAADKLWMSPCCGQACAAIHFTWEQDLAGVKAVLLVLRRTMVFAGLMSSCNFRRV